MAENLGDLCEKGQESDHELLLKEHAEEFFDDMFLQHVIEFVYDLMEGFGYCEVCEEIFEAEDMAVHYIIKHVVGEFLDYTRLVSEAAASSQFDEFHFLFPDQEKCPAPADYYADWVDEVFMTAAYAEPYDREGDLASLRAAEDEIGYVSPASVSLDQIEENLQPPEDVDSAIRELQGDSFPQYANILDDSLDEDWSECFPTIGIRGSISFKVNESVSSPEPPSPSKKCEECPKEDEQPHEDSSQLRCLAVAVEGSISLDAKGVLSSPERPPLAKQDVEYPKKDELPRRVLRQLPSRNVWKRNNGTDPWDRKVRKKRSGKNYRHIVALLRASEQ